MGEDVGVEDVRVDLVAPRGLVPARQREFDVLHEHIRRQRSEVRRRQPGQQELQGLPLLCVGTFQVRAELHALVVAREVLLDPVHGLFTGWPRPLRFGLARQRHEHGEHDGDRCDSSSHVVPPPGGGLTMARHNSRSAPGPSRTGPGGGRAPPAFLRDGRARPVGAAIAIRRPAQSGVGFGRQRPYH